MDARRGAGCVRRVHVRPPVLAELPGRPLVRSGADADGRRDGHPPDAPGHPVDLRQASFACHMSIYALTARRPGPTPSTRIATHMPELHRHISRSRHRADSAPGCNAPLTCQGFPLARTPRVSAGQTASCVEPIGDVALIPLPTPAASGVPLDQCGKQTTTNHPKPEHNIPSTQHHPH